MAGSAVGAREAALEGLTKDIIAAVDTKFSDLEAKLQAKFAAAAAETARMSDDVRQTRREVRAARFGEIERAQSRGIVDSFAPFRDREQAAAFGTAVAAIVENRPVDTAALQKAGITPGVGASGGFTLGETVANEVLSNLERFGVAARLIPVIDTQGDSMGVPRVSQGASVYYPDEGVATTEGAIKFASAKIAPTRHSVAAIVDRWMLRNSAALGVAVVDELSRALAQAIDTNVFVGDGTATYARTKGVFKRDDTCPAALLVTADAGDNTFVEACDASTKYVSPLVGAIPEVSEQFDPRVFCHRTIWFRWLGAKDSSGKPIADFYAGRGRELFGYPVECVPCLPKLSDATQASKVMAAFGAIGRAWRGVRSSAMELRQSQDVKFFEGQTAFCLDALLRYEEVDPNIMALLKTAAT